VCQRDLQPIGLSNTSMIDVKSSFQRSASDESISQRK
jgi:hypothetical protein